MIAGKKEILIGQKMVHVRLQVQHLSFSAHADAKGTIIKPQYITFLIFIFLNFFCLLALSRFLCNCDIQVD